MSGILKSIAERWEHSDELCALIPYERFFTGRIPETQQYRFPYCSLLVSPGWPISRSDKTTRNGFVVSFHIWVDDARLHVAELVQTAIYNTYANQCWPVTEHLRVFDVLDQGEGQSKQTSMPSVKAWTAIRMFEFIVERDRVDTGCCHEESSSFSSESSSSSDSGQ